MKVKVKLEAGKTTQSRIMQISQWTISMVDSSKIYNTEMQYSSFQKDRVIMEDIEMKWDLFTHLVSGV